ncbi:hypothetical protein [Botrimarina hoheduenensis]|uniref:Uncharacterized protein n=1 Tax=Botrimarina hoheduenensis TaxID=2528000 RepID=A0A5C5VXV8_9BACT|nr:hypothetical protein [Botrimarina hoheduenensis]TWT42753.1 hypothetical protein Pla111_27260 [Botrimarina hoheduenensis]
MPTEQPASQPKPSPATDDASRVGWFLTAITCLIVVVGLAVINYVTGSRPRPEPIAPRPSDNPSEALATPKTPPPIVLRAAEIADQRRDAPLYR